MNFIKTLLGIFVIAIMMQACGESYCDDSAVGRQIRRMEGTITAVDTFDSTFAVEWQGEDLIHYNVTTFKVPEGMDFYKGTDMVDILDINIGDPVTIEYYIDGSGNPQMVRMDIGQ
ncbi:MAG: hypothetical protein NTY76_01880 [Candidatus Omnitrophica bacterium]|nr:hypothetical protein [Candidatus Omnitrophota bacterium]